MKLLTVFFAIALATSLTGGALALDAAKPAPTSSPMAAPMTGGSDAAARSAECSKQADAQGLHGKPRKKFREACKKGK